MTLLTVEETFSIIRSFCIINSNCYWEREDNGKKYILKNPEVIANLSLAQLNEIIKMGFLDLNIIIGATLLEITRKAVKNETECDISCIFDNNITIEEKKSIVYDKIKKIETMTAEEYNERLNNCLNRLDLDIIIEKQKVYSKKLDSLNKNINNKNTNKI